jgi:hypothetical protein
MARRSIAILLCAVLAVTAACGTDAARQLRQDVPPVPVVFDQLYCPALPEAHMTCGAMVSGLPRSFVTHNQQPSSMCLRW